MNLEDINSKELFTNRLRGEMVALQRVVKSYKEEIETLKTEEDTMYNKCQIEFLEGVILSHSNKAKELRELLQKIENTELDDF